MIYTSLPYQFVFNLTLFIWFSLNFLCFVKAYLLSIICFDNFFVHTLACMCLFVFCAVSFSAMIIITSAKIQAEHVSGLLWLFTQVLYFVINKQEVNNKHKLKWEGKENFLISRICSKRERIQCLTYLIVKPNIQICIEEKGNIIYRFKKNKNYEIKRIDS